MRALKQFLNFKDRVIHKQKEVTEEMKEQRIRTEEAAQEMKIKRAALERLLEEKDRHKRPPDGLIREMNERQGSNIVFIERNVDIGKCALLRKVQQMGEEIRSLKERRTPPIESDSEDDEKNEIREHTVNSVARFETIYEEEEPTESDSDDDGQNERKEHTGISDHSLLFYILCLLDRSST